MLEIPTTAYIGKWHVDGHGRSAYIPPARRQGFEYFKALECAHDYQHAPERWGYTVDANGTVPYKN